MTYAGANGKFRATFHKYAGLWVPVVVSETNERLSFAHCATSGGAMGVAMFHAKTMANP